MATKNDLLKAASDEIKSLRAQNATMAARLNMFDDLMYVLKTPTPNQGMCWQPDIVEDIQKVLDLEKLNEALESSKLSAQEADKMASDVKTTFGKGAPNA